MATLAVAAAVRAGVALGASAAAGGGDQFPNTGKELLYIKNAGVGSITLTIVTQNTSDGLAVADRTVSVANGAEMVVGPFPRGIYNDGNGMVQLTYSGVTSVTVAVVSLTAALD